MLQISDGQAEFVGDSLEVFLKVFEPTDEIHTPVHEFILGMEMVFFTFSITDKSLKTLLEVGSREYIAATCVWKVFTSCFVKILAHHQVPWVSHECEAEVSTLVAIWKFSQWPMLS
jgi:hypothetical protein